MGAALGLAIQALGLGKVKMSLLPEAVKREQRAVARRWLFAGVAAAAIMLVVSEFASVSRETTGVARLNADMLKAFESVADMQEKVEERGRDVPQRRAQLARWAAVGADRGLYSAVLSRVLEVIAVHNQNLRDPGRDGEVLLGNLYVSWENPLAGGLGTALNDSNFGLARLNAKPAALRTTLFVAARFECRGDDAKYLVAFEKELQQVDAFKTVRAKPEDYWRVGSFTDEQLPFFQWRPATTEGGGAEAGAPAVRSDRNSRSVWMIWQYCGPGVGTPAVAGVKAGG